MKEYQWEILAENTTPKKDIRTWISDFGPKVVSRKKGIAETVRFDVLIDNPDVRVYLIGEFNAWGAEDLEKYELIKDEHDIIGSIEIKGIKHKDRYKFLVRDKKHDTIMQDPAAPFFDDYGHSIFWDFEDPGAYRQKYPLVDTINRSTRIIQTDLPGLIAHWADKDNKLGSSIPKNSYYRFITTSGVIEKIKELGFNTIQFLPFAQSIDGDNWKFRYLVPFQFSIQKNWGTPDEFAEMIDHFHKNDIAVIGDFVIGHMPFKDYKVFGRDGEKEGIQLWKNRHGSRLYMKEETPWGTMRMDYDNPHVRKFIIDSCIHFMRYYRIDGYRIDNVDGIIRYGPNGDGDERPNGRRFLRELNSTIYTYNPFSLIHFESHYYYNDNAKMLVVPFESDKRALGATAYNSSRITYYLHTEFMPKSAEDITPWKFKDITEEKEWGQSNSTIADFHNHDAAAGLMPMRCTGSYAYDTMTCKQPENHFHALGKIKVMEAIISFVTEGRTLDLLQTFLLQTGTFEHDSSIQWHLTYNEVSRNLVSYKKEINLIMEDPAFWPANTKNRKFLNLDDKNKVMVIKRSASGKNSSEFIIIINLSAWQHYNYKVGLDSGSDYRLILNGDTYANAGFGMASYPKIFKNRKSSSFELLDREIELPKLAPYGVVVLKKV